MESQDQDRLASSTSSLNRNEYSSQEQAMDMATFDKLMKVEQNLFNAGQATLEAWKIIGRNPSEAEGGEQEPVAPSSASDAGDISTNKANAVGRSNSTAGASVSSSSPKTTRETPPRADTGRNSLGAYSGKKNTGSSASTSNMFERNNLADYKADDLASNVDPWQSAPNVLAENGRSRSSHNVFGFTKDHPPQSDVTLFTFTVKKNDNVLRMGGKRASLQLQVDVEQRTLSFLSPHDSRESFSCAAVTAKPYSKLGMQLKIQMNSTATTKKILFLSNEDRSNFLQALEDGKVMYKKSSMSIPIAKTPGGASQDASTPLPAGRSTSTTSYETESREHSSNSYQRSADDSAIVLSENAKSHIRGSLSNDQFASLPGETVLEHVQRVTNMVAMSKKDLSVQGVLKITSYRITFTPYDSSWKVGSFEVPLATIDVITREGLMLHIQCKDLRTIQLSMHDAYSRKKNYDQLPSTPDFRWLNLLMLRMKPPNMIGALFAFDYNTEKTKELGPPTENGWYLYSPVAEYQRLGFLKSSDSRSKSSRERRKNGSESGETVAWRLLKNSKFRFSPSYPQLMVVPSIMTEDQLVQSARFRSRARLPVVVWRHPVNKSVLARSSQPNYGMAGNRSEPDRLLLRAYRDSAQATGMGVPPPLHIIDARKPIATKGNRLRGKGVENSQHYDNATIDFMGIANIHKMRESLEALKSLVSPSGVEDGDKNYHHRLENTRWLKHIMRVLSGARQVAESLHEKGASVLVHCSDGWDRTPQLTALAQLMLDPYYRTIRGFAVLVEKEWCSFGHKFADRIGVGKDITDQPSERSPVMLQFLDCVWQMTHQFTTCFEFNERFLLHVWDALVSGLYGTFLNNSEHQRYLDKVWERTESVWTPVLENPTPFKNPLFRSTNRVLYPRANLKRVVLWDAMYFRWDPESHPEYMEYMHPVRASGEDDDVSSISGFSDPAQDIRGTANTMTTDADLDAEEKAMRLEIDVIHDFDEFRTKPAISDLSEMSEDDEDLVSGDDASDVNRGERSLTISEDRQGSIDEDEILERYRRGAEERTRQRAQGRNIREALEMAPDASRIKYLEQLLGESVARELQLESELDSLHRRLAVLRRSDRSEAADETCM